MNKLGRILLAPIIVLVFCFAIVAAASASEVPQWLVEGKPIAVGTTVNDEIEMEGANLLLLEDMSSVKADLLCETSKSTGTLLYNGEGEVTAYECAKPVVDSGTCGSPKVSPVDLPWQTVIVEPETNVYELDVSSTSGSGAGFAVECIVFGVKVTDTCTTNDAKALLTNTEAGLVDAEFKEEVGKEEELSCSIGGKEAGLVVGLLALQALSAGKVAIPLSVSSAAVAFAGPSWWVKGARYGAGAKEKIKTTASETFTWESEKQRISCTGSNYTGEILGSGAEAVGAGKGTITFSGCKDAIEAGCEVYSILKKGTELSPEGQIGPIPVETELAFPRGSRLSSLVWFKSTELSAGEDAVFTVLLFKTKAGGTCALTSAEPTEIASIGQQMLGAEIQSPMTGDLMTAGEELAEVRIAFPTVTLTRSEFWNATSKRYVSPMVFKLRINNEFLVIKGALTTTLASTELFGWTNT